MSGATILGRMADRSSMLEVPALAKELGERFVDAGHELYLVGGSVRDMVQGRPSPDLDFATSAPPAETTRLLRGWADRKYLVGVAFGTVGALKDGERLEITTFRKEVYAEEHRKPSVTFGDDILVDLSRRDFTINAMAVRLPDGDFVDPYGGLKALAAKLLDTPLDPETSFSDDPLRMIRAARFVAQLEVRPADRVVEAMRALRGAGSRSCRPSGSATSSTSSSWGSTRRPVSRCWSTPGSPIASCPSSRRSASSRTRSTGTRTCCATPTRWSTGASPTLCCGWRRCCTTSASPRRGRSRPRA